jgi:hypothetical protein
MKKISFKRAAHDRIHRETNFARHSDYGESIQPAEPFATGIISGSRNRSNGRIRTQLEVSAAEASGTETRNAAEAPASPTDEATVPFHTTCRRMLCRSRPRGNQRSHFRHRRLEAGDSGVHDFGIRNHDFSRLSAGIRRTTSHRHRVV